MIIKRWGSSTFTVNFTLTSGQTGITAGNTAGLIPSMTITGTGIPAGTTISFITGSGTLTMSQAATVTGQQSLTFAGGFSEVHPKTVANKLFNNAGFDPLFDTNEQLKTQYLPPSVIGSMKFVGTVSSISAPGGPLNLTSLITGAVTAAYAVSTNLDTYTGITYGASSPGGYRPGLHPNKGADYVGHYWIVSSAFSSNTVTIHDPVAEGIADWRAAIFDDGVAPADAGSGIQVNGLSLELGDWVIITGYTSATDTFIFSVISNTYSNATTLAAGVTTLSGANNVGAFHATTNAGGITNGGTKVITEDNLFDMMGTGTTNIAYGSHVHGNITNAGAIGTDATLPIITTTGGVLTTGAFGTTAGTFAQGNDARLSDSRTPTSHTHGNITNGGLIGTAANLPIITGTGGILQAGSFGTTANTFTEGNDSRLSDARTPTSHTHGDLTNTGTIASNLAVGSGQHLVVTNSSDALKQSAITFGAVTTTFLRNDGAWGTPVGTTYAKATTSVLGLVETAFDDLASNPTITASTTTGRYYGVQLNSAQQMVVNVPWSDTNDQYTAAASGGLSVTGNAFRMVTPFFAQDDAPATPVAGTIWFDL